jgi:hypothetical protein
VIAWFPRPQVPLIAAGPAEPYPSHDRCWADEPDGQQCATVIDDHDLLGLCERHRALLRGDGSSSVASGDADGAPTTSVG